MRRGIRLTQGLGGACLLTELFKFCHAAPAGPTATGGGEHTPAPASSPLQSPAPLASERKYDYDVVVIGGGSGGIACAREAAKAGLKGRVLLLDWVAPSPQGTTWGLGGTCVNVGCIPKKIFRHAAELGDAIPEAQDFGWGTLSASTGSTVDWARLTGIVKSHISSLNWSYRTSLRADGVTYMNARGRLLDGHTVALEAPGKRSAFPSSVTARHIVIATGGRPTLPADVPGAREYCHTSDDLFSLPSPPGSTLVVGGGYVALETAGLLAGLGYPVTLAVRGGVLRGFDDEAGQLVLADLLRRGVTLRPGVQVACVGEQTSKDTPRKLVVTYKSGSVSETNALPPPETFDTVIFAVGRTASTASLGLDSAGVAVDAAGKVLCPGGRHQRPHPDSATSLTAPSVHAIGDVVAGRPELTPVAIAEGRALGRRLAASSLPSSSSSKRPSPLPPINYNLIPTAVFTPLPYACVGATEAEAVEAAAASTSLVPGQRTVLRAEAYRTAFATLEQAAGKKAQLAAAMDAEAAEQHSAMPSVLPSVTHPDSPCFMKVVTLKEVPAEEGPEGEDDGKEVVVGLHLVGPGAPEAIQGLALAMRVGAASGGLTKAALDAAIGVHPTFTEEVFGVTVSKSSGASFDKTEC